MRPLFCSTSSIKDFLPVLLKVRGVKNSPRLRRPCSNSYRSGKVDVVALARTLATEAVERHLQIWDEVPQYEQTIVQIGASGNIDTDDPTRTFHVAVENATATKLDYFVGRRDFRHGHYRFQAEAPT